MILSPLNHGPDSKATSLLSYRVESHRHTGAGNTFKRTRYYSSRYYSRNSPQDPLSRILALDIIGQKPNTLPKMCTDRYSFYACGCRQGAEQPFKVCDYARVNESLGDTSSKQYKNNEKKCEESQEVERVTLGTVCKDCEPKIIGRRKEDDGSAVGQNYGLPKINE